MVDVAIQIQSYQDSYTSFMVCFMVIAPQNGSLMVQQSPLHKVTFTLVKNEKGKPNLQICSKKYNFGLLF